ncbi:hypothetical protein KAR91_30705 [Candidatus Pacearchaeota archaeon]|nr:hypothetical protein [Candidatus Pacearchaeota archaeon]
MPTPSTTGKQSVLEQVVTVKKETVIGTLIKPVSTGLDAILGAGVLALNQDPGYTDSPEIKNSLNVSDTTQNQRKTGIWSMDMLHRPQVYNSTTHKFDPPMGDALLECIFGKKLAFTAAIVGVIATGVTTIPFDTFTGAETREVPQKGAISLEIGGTFEIIKYTGVSFTSDVAGSFTGCIRDYAGDAAKASVGAEPIVLACSIYTQHITRPSLSLYRRNGGFMEQVRGATVSQMTLEVGVDGQAMYKLSGGYMEGGRTGISTLNGAVSASADLVLQTDEAKFYSVGAIIYNETANDHKTGEGYKVTAVNLVTHTITIEQAVSWSNGDTISAYLPDEDLTPYQIPIRNQDSAFYIDSVEKKLKDVSLNYGAPMVYNENEISSSGLADYVADRRDVNMAINVVLKNADLALFSDADNSVTKSLSVRLGDGTAGETIWFEFPRAMLKTPEITPDQPVFNMAITATALDTEKEDSCAMVCI